MRVVLCEYSCVKLFSFVYIRDVCLYRCMCVSLPQQRSSAGFAPWGKSEGRVGMGGGWVGIVYAVRLSAPFRELLQVVFSGSQSSLNERIW